LPSILPDEPEAGLSGAAAGARGRSSAGLSGDAALAALDPLDLEIIARLMGFPWNAAGFLATASTAAGPLVWMLR
jgi:hypothetical protein